VDLFTVKAFTRNQLCPQFNDVLQTLKYPVNDNLVTAGHLPVHSYYRNKDQFGLQDQFFRNRTSLFKDQISRGNASLQLTGVEVQDQGRYRCYTSTMRGKEESFINLRQKHHLEKTT
uniref:Immunoglobulin V-set domain-containing protein n=1 Tax=Lates calcarifer TaxID=8187 RepID=A0A4W6G2M8_LATCA